MSFSDRLADRNKAPLEEYEKARKWIDRDFLQSIVIEILLVAISMALFFYSGRPHLFGVVALSLSCYGIWLQSAFRRALHNKQVLYATFIGFPMMAVNTGRMITLVVGLYYAL